MRLRALEPEDLELLYTIENDTEMWNVGSQTAPLSRFHLRDYIANNACDIYKDEQVRYIIEVTEGKRKEAIGIIDLFNFSPQHNRAELGVAILKKHARCGYAQRAISEISKIGKNIIHLKQIYAIVPEEHHASLRMLEKSGFCFGGTLKEWLYNGEKYANATIMQLFL